MRLSQGLAGGHHLVTIARSPSAGRRSRTGLLRGIQGRLGLGLGGLVSRVSLVLASLLRIAAQRLAFFLGNLPRAVGLRHGHDEYGGGTVFRTFRRDAGRLAAFLGHVFLRVLTFLVHVRRDCIGGLALVAAGESKQAHRYGSRERPAVDCLHLVFSPGSKRRGVEWLHSSARILRRLLLQRSRT